MSFTSKEPPSEKIFTKIETLLKKPTTNETSTLIQEEHKYVENQNNYLKIPSFDQIDDLRIEDGLSLVEKLDR